MNKRIVVGIGEALWDMLPSGKQIGGAPINFAYHVARLGLDSVAISAVGDDSLGIELVSGLKNKGMNIVMPAIHFPTGTVLVKVNGNGIPSYDICENVAWDNIPFTSALKDLAAQSKAVCFGSLAKRSDTSRDTIRKFIGAVPEDCLKIFDINLRQHYYSDSVILNSLASCNILKLNDEELPIIAKILSNNEAPFELCRKTVKEYGLKYLILTCGAEGSHIFSPNGESHLPTPSVKVVDTVGAGDSFTAAFVASILNGLDFKDAHKKAVEVSAYVCTQPGATPK